MAPVRKGKEEILPDFVSSSLDLPLSPCTVHEAVPTLRLFHQWSEVKDYLLL
jgi:hypothetical protein